MLERTKNQAIHDAYASLIEILRNRPIGGYQADAPDASEPTAWAGLVLNRAGLQEQAAKSADWLASLQQPDGSVGVTIDQTKPAWPTSLSILLWQSLDPEKYQASIKAGIDWALAQTPWTRPVHENFGHNTMLEGWSWAADTHSWVEPTAFFVKAFHAAGKVELPRFEQAKDMLIDRLLPSGGANYGNTIMLGQELLQHLQPTGIVAWVLADYDIVDSRIEKTLDYLAHSLSEPTGVTSLAFGLLGLSANASRYAKPLPIATYRDHVVKASQQPSMTTGIFKSAILAYAIQNAFGLSEFDDRVTMREVQG